MRILEDKIKIGGIRKNERIRVSNRESIARNGCFFLRIRVACKIDIFARNVVMLI